MANVCAKPACAEDVQVWLDFAPTTRQVVERLARSEISVGLCANHEARFTVPEGWTFERLDTPKALLDDETQQDTVEVIAEIPQPSSRPVRSPRAEGRPWFLALSDATPSPVSPENVAEDLDEPTVGSLLHRAFHGPDSESDVEPETAQLPFPPFEPEHRVAVS